MAVTASHDLPASAETDPTTSRALLRTTSAAGGAQTDEANPRGRGQLALRRTNLLDLPDELLTRVYQCLRGTDFAMYHAEDLDCLLINKRLFRLGFPVCGAYVNLEDDLEIYLPQLLTNNQQRDCVRTLSLTVWDKHDVGLAAIAVATLPALVDISIDALHLDVPSRDAVVLLRTLSRCASLAKVSLYGFEDVQPADCSDLSAFSPSLRHIVLHLSANLTAFLLQRFPTVRTVSINSASATVPAIPWDTVVELHVSFSCWRERMSNSVKRQLKHSLYSDCPSMSTLRSLHLHIDWDRNASEETKLSAVKIVADILSLLSSAPIATIEIRRNRESDWPTLHDRVCLSSVKTLTLIDGGWNDAKKDKSWPSMIRFLSHFPVLLRLNVAASAYRQITLSEDGGPCSMNEFTLRLQPSRLFADFAPLAALLSFTRTTSVLNLRVPAGFLNSGELRATRATCDEEFSVERWTVTKLQL